MARVEIKHLWFQSFHRPKLQSAIAPDPTQSSICDNKEQSTQIAAPFQWISLPLYSF